MITLHDGNPLDFREFPSGLGDEQNQDNANLADRESQSWLQPYDPTISALERQDKITFTRADGTKLSLEEARKAFPEDTAPTLQTDQGRQVRSSFKQALREFGLDGEEENKFA
jgi:hypothetical protein